MQLFEHIEDLADDPLCFVAVLIDEIESLAASRAQQGQHEPGDATRYEGKKEANTTMKSCCNLFALNYYISACML